MNKLFAISFALAAGMSALVFGQERKPVIGLTEIFYSKNFQTVESGWGRLTHRDSDNRLVVDAEPEEYPEISTVSTQIRAAFPAAIVNSKRFAVMERSAEELDKIRQENVETSGELNPNTGLDFLLTGDIVEYEARREKAGLFSLDSITKMFKLGVSVKFTDVHSGQIVISETIAKDVKDGKVTPNECAVAMANELIAKITTKLYPPMVLSVSGPNKIVQIPNSAYQQGDTVELFKQGEPILDPYTGTVVGYEEEFVALVVVFEINGSTNIAKAAPDPKGSYAAADIQKGGMVRAVDKKTDKPAIKNFKKAGIIK